jgi:hypothetical protein
MIDIGQGTASHRNQVGFFTGWRPVQSCQKLAKVLHDGSYESMQGLAVREGVYQEAPERVTFRSQGYLPEIGARLATIWNETHGEEYERKSYIYTVPVVNLAMSTVLELEQHIILEENHFLGMFISRASASLAVPERGSVL